MLEQRIQTDLMSAMKEKNNTRVAALRSIKTAIQNEKTSGKFHELTDADVIGIIQKLSKQRKEAADIYVDAGRNELAEKELAEKVFIDEYLPKMMSNDELAEKISEIVAELGADSIKQMGLVMKSLKEKYSGQYDPGAASAIVKSKLS